MTKKFIAIIATVCICLTALISCTAPANGTSTEKAMTKEDYANALGSVNQKCLELSSASASAKFSIFESLASDEYIPADRFDIIRACVWFVGFLENICKNESFALTDGFTECTATFEGEIFNIRFTLSYNSENSRILSVCYAYDIKRDTSMLLESDINYDTVNKKLNDFFMNAHLGAEDFYKFKYDGASLFQLDEKSASYASFAADINSAVAAHIAKEWSANLTDYSKEYADACPYGMR